MGIKNSATYEIIVQQLKDWIAKEGYVTHGMYIDFTNDLAVLHGIARGNNIRVNIKQSHKHVFVIDEKAVKYIDLKGKNNVSTTR